MFRGSCTALITPFTESEDLDSEAFRRLVARQIEEGSDAILVAGSTGESATLSCEEQARLIEIAVSEARGRIPVIAGTGSNNTRIAVERTKRARDKGADGCLVIFPYYNRPGKAGCFAHFAKISEVGLPVIVYHHPGRTGLRFSPEELAELCSLPGIKGLKEASHDLEVAARFMALSDTPLFSGDDDLMIPCIRAGARGSISILGNIRPALWADAVRAALSGDIAKARALYNDLEPLFKALVAETNPQGIKYAMSLENRCLPVFRLPLVPPSQSTRDRIAAVLN